MKRVALCDLAALDGEMGRELREAALEVIASGRFILGETVSAFEAAMAEAHGVAHAVGVGSGSDALMLALRAAGLGEGDVVATTPLSFIATAEAILRVGARPLFVDVDDGGLLCREALEAALSAHDVAAVLPVHLYGRVVEGLSEVLGDRILVHDAAQAVGARDGDAALGAHGPACLSFFPSKSLGAWGDGGMVLTDDEPLAARVRRGRIHGRDEEGRFVELGLNSRLDALQAAVLHRKLDAFETLEARRRQVQRHYRQALRDLAWLRLPPPLRAFDGAHLFTVRVPAASRAALVAHLDARGIDSRVYYPRLLVDEPAIAPHATLADGLVRARRFSDEALSLPAHAHLTEADLGRVVEALEAFSTSP